MSYGERSQGQGRGPASYGPPAKQRVHDVWIDYLKEGYFDAAGNLRIEYVSRERVEPLIKEMCGHNGLTTHQVRRYFGHCRSIETHLKAKGMEWARVWPLVKKLDISAADGAAKSPPKIPALFHDFIRCNVASVKSQKDFIQGFLPHFEAVLGFGQAHFRER